jgi:hypothetical protein
LSPSGHSREGATTPGNSIDNLTVIVGSKLLKIRDDIFMFGSCYFRHISGPLG